MTIRPHQSMYYPINGLPNTHRRIILVYIRTYFDIYVLNRISHGFSYLCIYKTIYDHVQFDDI